ncbi:hypothetical protein GCM10010411_63870 [Actinomadura fulvescens]|uniref:Uncharacterized protein n=1 Tax=Actinomadura fulvescens TaxID=46160 RepID=A0ABN3Q7Q6_9ACTN
MTLLEPVVQAGGAPYGLSAERPNALPAETDLDLAAVWLQRRYPDLCCWWGEYTGSIWALLPGQLVEAKNAIDLARRIDALSERSTPRDVTGCFIQQEKAPQRTPKGSWEDRGRQPSLAPGRTLSSDVATCRRRNGRLSRVLAGCRRILLREAQLGSKGR